MRIIIALNLGHMGPKASVAVPALQSLLGDPEQGLHDTCIKSLAAITSKTPSP